MDDQKNMLENDLQVEEEVHLYLRQIAIWAKIVGIIAFVFAVVSTVNTIVTMIKMLSYADNPYFSVSKFISRMTIPLISVTAYFAIGLFAYRFAVKMHAALNNTEQPAFDKAWFNLKIAYRIMGIVLGVYLLLLCFALIFAGAYL